MKLGIKKQPFFRKPIFWVGVGNDLSLEVFDSQIKPSRKVFGVKYAYVIGPYELLLDAERRAERGVSVLFDDLDFVRNQ